MLVFILGFSIGIFQELFFSVGVWWGYCLLLATIGTFMLLRQRRPLPLIVLLLLGMSLGVIRASFERQVQILDPSLLTTSVSLEGRIVSRPEERADSTRFILEVAPDVARVLVYAPAHTDLSYGMRVLVTGKLEEPEAFLNERGREVPYPAMLARQGIGYQIFFAELTVLSEAPWSIRGVLYSFADYVRKSIRLSVREPEASLGIGMLLGGGSSLPRELQDELRRAGIIHIVVLSGYNVALVAEFVALAFRSFGVRARFVVTLLGISGLVLMSGAEAAAVRAGLMASALALSRVAGRSYDAFRILVLAAGLMLVWNPKILLFDPGFQLSVAATAGIILFTAPLERYLALFIRSQKVREAFALTIAAQVSVFPLLLWMSGEVNVVSLPANLLVLPFVPLGMFATALTALVASVYPLFALPLSFITTAILWYIVFVGSMLGSLSFATIGI